MLQLKIDSSLYFWRQAINLAEELGDSERIKNVTIDGFYTFFDQGKYYEAKLMVERGLKNAKKLNDDLNISKCYIMLSNLYFEIKDYTEFYSTVTSGIEYAERAEDSHTVATAY